jgi:hypothetical protein
MKKISLLFVMVLLAGSMCGCFATPGYNAGWPSIVYPDTPNNGEAANRILRDMDYDFKQAADDFNHVMLFEPASHLTKWNVR